MQWAEIAQELLDAATAAAEVDRPIDRSIIAAGPDYAVAFRCRTVAVYLATPAQPPTSTSTLGLAPCASVPQVTYQVEFRADCAPMAGGAKGAPPDAAAVTAWSREFLDDVQRIHAALADACSALGRRCGTVTLGAGQGSGPAGGTAAMSWPVTIVMP